MWYGDDMETHEIIYKNLIKQGLPKKRDTYAIIINQISVFSV
jgi:hypothetical protein